MAKKKTELNSYVSILEKDYLELLEASILLRALKIAGIEKMPIYKSATSIIEDGRVEIHMDVIKAKYR